MSPDTVFVILTYGVLPAWASMIFAPRSALARWIVHTAWVPAVVALGFTWAFASSGPWPPGAGFTTLPGVMALSDSPHLALAGWLHATAFDLFVATWAVRDAERLGIPHALVAPYLLLAVVLGPLALLLYLLLRALWAGRWTIVEGASRSARRPPLESETAG